MSNIAAIHTNLSYWSKDQSLNLFAKKYWEYVELAILFFSHWKSAWLSYEVSFISTPWMVCSESRKWLHSNYAHDFKTQLRKVLWPIMQYGMLGWTPLHLSSLEELLKKILENSQKLHLFMALPNAKRIAARGSKHQKIWFGP